MNAELFTHKVRVIEDGSATDFEESLAVHLNDGWEIINSSIQYGSNKYANREVRWTMYWAILRKLRKIPND